MIGIDNPTSQSLAVFCPTHCWPYSKIRLTPFLLSQNLALIVVGCRLISTVKCSTHLCLDLHIFMTFFNYKQCFKNEDKAIDFVYLFDICL